MSKCSKSRKSPTSSHTTQQRTTSATAPVHHSSRHSFNTSAVYIAFSPEVRQRPFKAACIFDERILQRQYQNVDRPGLQRLGGSAVLVGKVGNHQFSTIADDAIA